ncbi:putative isoleucine N-monooxygenase [Helianthus annuus]|nr:putative isoleucine N-monooxygenase [Helianthus annuus]
MHSNPIQPSLPYTGLLWGGGVITFGGCTNTLTLIGCAIQMFLNKPIFRWIHKLMDHFDTPILCIRIGPSTHVIAVSSPDIACEFLKKQDEIFISRPDFMSACLISDGYLTAIMSPFGEQWRKMKKVINRGMLSPQIHKWLQPKRDQEAD